MKNWLFSLVSIALIFAMNTVSAGLYVGYSNADFRFEIYRGNTYSYVGTPYTYAYNDYYYFDYPFRVYSNKTYHYYQPGWYGYEGYTFAPDLAYDTYWTYAPDYYLTNYTYYPADYYYYGGLWTYSPNWVSAYGPAYYGSYYFPPSQPTLVGQQFQPAKEASCNEAGILTNSVSVDAGETKRVTFYISNDSVKYLDAENVSVSIDAFGVHARNVKFDKTVRNGTLGKIEFDLHADKDVESETVDAEVRASATFKDGTFCTGSDLNKRFRVSVYAPRKAADVMKGRDAPVYSTVQGSTAYRKAKESKQVWKEVRFADDYDYAGQTNSSKALKQDYYTAEKNSYDTYRGKGTMEYSTYGNTGRKTYGATVKNYGATQNDTTGVKSTNFRTTYYGEKQSIQQNCEALSVSVQDISVRAGAEKSAYFTLKNFGGEDFTIDSLEAVEFSPEFSLEASRDSRIVYAGSTAGVKVTALGFETEKDGKGSGYLKVLGHYNSGLECSFNSEGFYVGVNTAPNKGLNEASLSAPAKISLKGGSGFVEFGFDNPSDKEVVVKVYSGDTKVSPAAFSFGPMTAGTRVVAVNGLEEGEAKVFFSAQANGKEFLQRYVKAQYRPFEAKDLADSKAVKETVKTESPKTAESGAQQNNGTLQGIRNFVSTGFTVLNTNAAAIGVVVLALILIGLLVNALRK